VKAVDLFAGCGGVSLGLKQAGMDLLASVEIEGDAVKSLAANNLEPLCADIRKPELIDDIDGHIDLLWASPPCQGWSKLGDRDGPNGSRNGYPWTLDIIDRLIEQGRGPRWVICENVVAVTSHSGECRDGKALSSECPGCWWDSVLVPAFKARFAWTRVVVLDAADYSVPQRRRRCFVIAGPHGIELPTPTHQDPKKISQLDMFACARKPWTPMRVALDSLEGKPWADGKLGGTQQWRLDVPAPTVSASEWRGSSDVAALKVQRTADALYLATGRPRLTTLEAGRLQGFDDEFIGNLVGSRKAKDRQIGNAVPPQLAEALARSVMEADRCPK
jgi:DNA (cytosine-5)-methyltransferase 1